MVTCAHTLAAHSSYVVGVACAEDIAISGSWDCTLKVWDIESGREIRTLMGHNDRVRGVALIDNCHVVSCSDDKTLNIWDFRTGKKQHDAVNLTSLNYRHYIIGQHMTTLKGHPGKVRCVTATSDGKWIISGAEDKLVGVWHAQEPFGLKHFMEGHTSWVEAVATSPVDDLIASCANDGDCTVKLWSLHDGVCLKTLTGHKRIVYALAFGLQGDYLVSCSLDKTIRVWSTINGNQLARLTYDDQLDALCLFPWKESTLLAVGEHSGLLSLLQPIWPVAQVGEKRTEQTPKKKVSRWD